MSRLLVAALMLNANAQAGWPLWQSYARHFYSEGRIVDHDRKGTTTSEGQSYGLFFALISNDQERFDAILDWTNAHLFAGNTLPAWHWANGKIQDSNPASDADLWIAYTLTEASRLWEQPKYAEAATALLNGIEATEIKEVTGLGPILLPGSNGFVSKSAYTLNASYLPPQICERFTSASPLWKQIARGIPTLLRGSAPGGFVLDWIAYAEGEGFGLTPVPVTPLTGSYDAIRVYLWAGLMHKDAPQRAEILSALKGMTTHLRLHTYPPEHALPDGTVRDSKAGPGFSAAVIPFLLATGDTARASANAAKLHATFDPGSGLYGKPPRYYDQNLAMFATGFMEGRYRFEPSGKLWVSWR